FWVESCSADWPWRFSYCVVHTSSYSSRHDCGLNRISSRYSLDRCRNRENYKWNICCKEVTMGYSRTWCTSPHLWFYSCRISCTFSCICNNYVRHRFTICRYLPCSEWNCQQRESGLGKRI